MNMEIKNSLHSLKKINLKYDNLRKPKKKLESVGQLSANSLVIADCLEAMKYIADKSIDCILKFYIFHSNLFLYMQLDVLISVLFLTLLMPFLLALFFSIASILLLLF